MKKVLLTLTICALLFTGCGHTDNSAAPVSDEVVTLRIANCEEYIDEGGWDADETIELSDGEKIRGVDSLVSDFEKWYQEKYGKKVRVLYSTYGTNEDLYNQMTLGNTFDLVCPSDYMIMKLMREKKLEPLSTDFYDTKSIYNYYAKGVSPYILKRMKALTEGGVPITDYAVGYMWGTMGTVYTPKKVDEADTKTFEFYLNHKYYKRITIKDSIRDTYFAGLAIVKESQLNKPGADISKLLNDTSQNTVDKVEDVITDMRVPEEGSNLWFDGWVMMKNGINGDSTKKQAAEAFINFISRPDSVIRNMYYIGYTSAITGGDDDRIEEYLNYTYGSDSEDAVDYDLSYLFGKKCVIKTDAEQLKRQLFAQYPTEDVLKRCAVMECFSDKANRRISQMWTNVRCYRFPWE